jgi:hypothetical protein
MALRALIAEVPPLQQAYSCSNCIRRLFGTRVLDGQLRPPTPTPPHPPTPPFPQFTFHGDDNDDGLDPFHSPAGSAGAALVCAVEVGWKWS